MRCHLPRHAFLLALLSVHLPAQDPKVPPSRFQVQIKKDILVTWSDGYKTKMDIYAPKQKPSKTGWPCVLIVHGKTGHRAIPENRQQGIYFASFGYTCIAYDVREDGITRKLNPTGDTSVEAKIRDSAESFYKAASLAPGWIDLNRLAVTGRSMGGSHAYRAAAWSGKPLPKAGPIIKIFPKISAVAGDWQVLDKLEDLIPGGTMLSAGFVKSLFDNRLKDPVSWNLAQGGQYQLLRNQFAKSPYFNLVPQLQQNKVPVLSLLGFRDIKHMVYNLTREIPKLSQIPHKLYLSVRGHGLPDNKTEWLLHMDMKRRFWDRFLKSQKNGIIAEPMAEVGILPTKPSDYANPTTQWKHIQSQSWPPSLPTTSLFLGQANKLLSKNPPLPQLSAKIKNQVSSSYNLANFASNPKLPSVLSKIPFSRIRYQSAPLGQSRTLLGRAHFSGTLKVTGPAGQISAALYDLPPQGKPVFVTLGFVHFKGNPTGKVPVQITLDDIAFTFPKGHRIGLALQNLCIRETIPHKAKDPYLFLAPEFSNFEVQVAFGGLTPAKLDLPLSSPPNSLLPRIAEVSFGNNLSFPFRIQSKHPGGVSYVLLGNSGIQNGLNLPPYIPLHIDQWTLLGTALIGTPILSGFLSVLDPNGQAGMKFQVPGTYKKFLIGQRFTFAPLIFDKGTLFSGSPTEILIRP